MKSTTAFTVLMTALSVIIPSAIHAQEIEAGKKAPLRPWVGRPVGGGSAGSLVLTENQSGITATGAVEFVNVQTLGGGMTTDDNHTYLKVPSDGFYLISISVVDNLTTNTVFGAFVNDAQLPGLLIDTTNSVAQSDGVVFTQSIVAQLEEGDQITLRNASESPRNLTGSSTNATRASLTVVRVG